MMAAETGTRLIDRLPPTRGKYTANARLSRITWFRVGGPAEVLFRPVDRDDLAGFLRARPDDGAGTGLRVGVKLPGQKPGEKPRFFPIEMGMREGRHIELRGDLPEGTTVIVAGDRAPDADLAQKKGQRSGMRNARRAYRRAGGS